jgi:hypothetical protein
MTLEALMAWVIAAAATLHDSRGAGRPMPDELAHAIAEASIATPLFEDEDGDRKTAGTLVVFGFWESGFRMSPPGYNDAGKACGPFQVHAVGWRCTKLRTDPFYAATVAIETMRRSITGPCERPFALYASGGCARGAYTSEVRERAIKALLVEVQP